MTAHDASESVCQECESQKARPCRRCGKHVTPEGHDACLGTLPGFMNACCGHGCDANAYVQFPDGTCVRGRPAIDAINLARRKEKP